MSSWDADWSIASTSPKRDTNDEEEDEQKDPLFEWNDFSNILIEEPSSSTSTSNWQTFVKSQQQNSSNTEISKSPPGIQSNSFSGTSSNQQNIIHNTSGNNTGIPNSNGDTSSTSNNILSQLQIPSSSQPNIPQQDNNDPHQLFRSLLPNVNVSFRQTPSSTSYQNQRLPQAPPGLQSREKWNPMNMSGFNSNWQQFYSHQDPSKMAQNNQQRQQSFWSPHPSNIPPQMQNFYPPGRDRSNQNVPWNAFGGPSSGVTKEEPQSNTPHPFSLFSQMNQQHSQRTPSSNTSGLNSNVRNSQVNQKPMPFNSIFQQQQQQQFDNGLWSRMHGGNHPNQSNGFPPSNFGDQMKKMHEQQSFNQYNQFQRQGELQQHSMYPRQNIPDNGKGKK